MPGKPATMRVVAAAVLAAATIQCGPSSSVVPGNEDAAGAPVVASAGSPLAEGGPRTDAGRPAEGPSFNERANDGNDAHSSTDAPHAVDGEPADVAVGEASEALDAPPEASGDASECMSDSDCEPGQWCVQFIRTLGPAVITHNRCVTSTCTSLDCTCAQSMCGTGYNCAVDAGRLVCQDLTGV